MENVCALFLKKAVPSTRFQESLILLPGSVGELYFAKHYLWIQVPKNIIKKVFSNDVSSLRNVVSSIVTIHLFCTKPPSLSYFMYGSPGKIIYNLHFYKLIFKLSQTIVNL